MGGVSFWVPGLAVPKQSFRVSGRGGYTPEEVKAWQAQVGWAGKAVMAGRPLFEGELQVEAVFYLPDHRRRDCDNLFKAIGDGAKGVVWRDDCQIMHIEVTKCITKEELGVLITVNHWGEECHDVD